MGISMEADNATTERWFYKKYSELVPQHLFPWLRISINSNKIGFLSTVEPNNYYT